MNPRQPYAGLTPEEIDAIAERAAERAIEKITSQFGMGVLKRLAYLTGAVVLSLLIWLAGNGALKP